jgi:hypothetical protein
VYKGSTLDIMSEKISVKDQLTKLTLEVVYKNEFAGPALEEFLIMNDADNYRLCLNALRYSLGTHFEGIDEDEVAFEDDLAEITGGDVIEAQHAILTAAEHLHIYLDYKPFDLYERFTTVKEVVDYFFSQFDFNINIENPKLLKKVKGFK